MRHDKGMFATRSIENAHDGKMIGNIERLSYLVTMLNFTN